MPRPKTKEELLKLSRENFKKLNDYIDSFSDEKKRAEFPEGTMNRNISDVLAHLHEWHKMFLEWYLVGMKDEKPEMPARGYTWKTLPELNKKIWEEYKSMKLDETQVLLNESFEDVQAIVKKHSEEELFEKKRFRWTGSTSLGAYLVSTTSSHYEWAYKLIRKAKNSSAFVA